MKSAEPGAVWSRILLAALLVSVGWTAPFCLAENQETVDGLLGNAKGKAKLRPEFATSGGQPITIEELKIEFKVEDGLDAKTGLRVTDGRLKKLELSIEGAGHNKFKLLDSVIDRVHFRRERPVSLTLSFGGTCTFRQELKGQDTVDTKGVAWSVSLRDDGLLRINLRSRSRLVIMGWLPAEKYVLELEGGAER